MCGNAVRCAAKLVWERRSELILHGKTDGEAVLTVDTPAGTWAYPSPALARSGV